MDTIESPWPTLAVVAAFMLTVTTMKDSPSVAEGCGGVRQGSSVCLTRQESVPIRNAEPLWAPRDGVPMGLAWQHPPEAYLGFAWHMTRRIWT